MGDNYPFTSVDNGGPVSGERLAEIREQAEYCSITVEAEELLWLLDQADGAKRLQAEAVERERGHKGALDAMWDTVLQADAETAALRAQIEKVLSEVNSWDLSDDRIDQLASDRHPVRRAEQWLKLTSYRACAESVKAILSVHHCLKCGKAMDVEHTTEFVVHMVRHEDDRSALGLDQDGGGQ